MTNQQKESSGCMAQINTAIWQSPRFRVIPNECKLLYVYLLTHPDVSDLGTLPLPALKELPRQFGLSEASLSHWLQHLEGLGFVMSERMTGFLWLPDFFWHNPLTSLERIAGWEKTHTSLAEGWLKPKVTQAAVLAVQQFTLRGYTALSPAFKDIFLNPHFPTDT